MGIIGLLRQALNASMNRNPIGSHSESGHVHRVKWLGESSEVSSLSGIFILNGYAVDVAVFSDTAGFWRIATFDAVNPPLYWADIFFSDEDAWEAFLAAVERDGMETLSGEYQHRYR